MINETRNERHVSMTRHAVHSWTFLTRHAQVLLCIADDPGIRLRDIGDRVGITERAAHRIVGELADGGYISRERRGRRNHYAVQPEQPLPDAIARDQSVGTLLDILVTRRSAPSPG
jgi:DNA-binding MarR family transcriptional regulator